MCCHVRAKEKGIVNSIQYSCEMGYFIDFSHMQKYTHIQGK